MRFDSEIIIPIPAGRHVLQLRWASLLASLGWAGDSEPMDILISPGEVLHFDCKSIDVSNNPRIKLYPRGGLAPDMPPGPAGAEARVLEIAQLERVEEPLGDDVRLIDNGGSPAPVTRTLKASREWTRTLALGENSTLRSTGELGANLLWLSAKGSIEAELQRTSALEIGSTHLFEEEISVTVPAHTVVQIVLGWKRIWQAGEARVLLPGGSVQIVPYRVVVNVTFDQKIQGVTGR
ncbi:hypothetical protein [Kitasatospora purpeofusca]|uniref:hypothetical protein n=1 Tax=Kitasatospora purpeofusca TaxID=67352 RepID=UPI003813445C